MAAQQYPNMYQDFDNPNRSPGRIFNGTNTLNRQSSRHFDNPSSYTVPQSQGIYTADDFPSTRYDTARGYDRMNNASTIHANYQYDSQPWSYGGGANGGAHTLGGTGRLKGGPPRRAGIPTGWLEPQMPPPQQALNYNGLGSQYGHGTMHQLAMSRVSPSNGDDEELIPTAIVIKNIPFAVKKEQLIAIMTDMNLPLPYAFNYHFDNGVFRGLAFANFTTADETATVIDHMNHMELQGRKLRVEYKKMLPAMEREKIERDKRERRGQLEEQHRPTNVPNSSAILHQASMSSLNSAAAASPAPTHNRGKKSSRSLWSKTDETEYDLNDPLTLQFYNELMLFKNSSDREHLIFPATTTPQDRRTIHTLAHHMGLEHRSEGVGETRCVTILKSRSSTISPPAPQPSYYNESRRGLNRAATVDFSEVRDTYHSHTLGRQGSGLLDIPGSPGLGGLAPAQNLRAAKSFADLRSYTPSPVPSSASFPANLAQNVSRYATDYGHSSAATGTPNLTPTSATERSGREESFLVSGIANMGMGFDRANSTRVNNGGRIGQERELHNNNAGAIGSQRPGNSNNTFDESQRNGTSTVPERQPRGPGAEWGGNFSRPRQNGHVNRGSDSSDRSAPQRYL